MNAEKLSDAYGDATTIAAGVNMSAEEIDALPVGTVVVWPHNQCAWQRDPSPVDLDRPWMSAGHRFTSSHVASLPVLVVWTPPPVEPAPWEQISTDREQPTLARVTFTSGLEVVGNWVRNADEYFHLVGDTGSYRDPSRIESVELLDLLPPEHVAVPESLLNAIEGAREGRLGCPDVSLPPLLDSLAALAKGADQ